MLLFFYIRGTYSKGREGFCLWRSGTYSMGGGGLFEDLQHKSMVDLRSRINLCQIQLFVKQITYSPIWSYS